MHSGQGKIRSEPDYFRISENGLLEKERTPVVSRGTSFYEGGDSECVNQLSEIQYKEKMCSKCGRFLKRK